MSIELLLAVILVPILTLVIEHLVLRAARQCRDVDTRRTDAQAWRARDDR